LSGRLILQALNSGCEAATAATAMFKDARVLIGAVSGDLIVTAPEARVETSGEPAPAIEGRIAISR
jgi:hypothetical protein